jgi:DNA-binding response OmpR family regulator
MTQTPDARPRVVSKLEPPLVLAADDDEVILGLITYRLEHSGYRVITASDGEEALALAIAQRPSLAVIDVMMPKLDGYEVTRALRSHNETRHLPIILLTARAQKTDEACGIEAGADAYLPKPFSPEELRSRVEGLLARRQT